MKDVVILSGGMDSATLLAFVISEHRQPHGANVHCLTFDYGQRHNREIAAAKSIAQHFGVAHQVVDIGVIGVLFPGSSQTDPRVSVPHGHYADENMKTTVVPFRNLILLSIGAGYASALARGPSRLWYGAHAGDHDIYPDCRETFVDALAVTLGEGDYDAPTLQAPFLQMTKGDICKLGVKLAVPFAKTWTCYEGGQHPCGQCGACVERLEAFNQAGIEDPLLDYETRKVDTMAPYR